MRRQAKPPMLAGELLACWQTAKQGGAEDCAEG
jgi:hypothetical protein